MLYPGTILYQDYDKLNKLYGTRKIETVFWNKVHAYPMHLSYDQAKYLSLLVERLLNNYEKYDVCRKTTIGYNNISEKEYLGLLLKENDYYNLRFIIDDNVFKMIREIEQ